MIPRPIAEAPAWRGFGRRLDCACRGVKILLRTQANARLHAGSTCLAILAGVLLRISRLEWCAVVAAIGLVWGTEGLNSALEAAVDLASPKIHPLAGQAKDIAAAAVLLAAAASLVIGILVFGPRLVAVAGF